MVIFGKINGAKFLSLAKGVFISGLFEIFTEINSFMIWIINRKQTIQQVSKWGTSMLKIFKKLP